MVPYTLAIELTPTTLRRLIDCVHADRYAEALEPDRFTLTEMVAHLADWEDLFLDRMRLAHEAPGSTVVVYDEGERAVEKHYSTRDLQHELDVFENRRRDTMDFLNGLSEEEWSKSFLHPQRGPLTIRDQVTMLLGHDLYHLEQASQYLR
ncbi:DinB family protein [Fimbriimonas ginsengisoli]|uniref:DinB-like domain-containing protein n=1 Tax=Fimbriimonas ginsengisoli Gsoil 348 TaxID=661478 RepID=A0A068NZ47_FIMGI|nr:DinB family protein [Fimbriimonas ginsengisoli]AIE87944.1 hypothetical protein OP10G_4576 [Fimbriimonas ginsengisoli Gsoil 348]